MKIPFNPEPPFNPEHDFNPEHHDPEETDEHKEFHNRLRDAEKEYQLLSQTHLLNPITLDLLSTEIDRILNECPNAECSVCAVIICPKGDEMHFHHDGCPSC